MRINLSHRRGSTLLVALVVTGIISSMLGSYLYLMQTQNRTVAYSHSWNSALPIAEAGVEEAMAHLAKNGTTNLETDGWKLAGNHFMTKRSFGDENYNVQIRAISNSTYGFSNITIRSTGFVKHPLDSAYVSRTVEVSVNYKFKFLGIVTKVFFALKGNFYADSYDSADTNYSTGGLYDPAKKDDDAFIGTNSQTNNSTIGGTINVLGTVATGPGGAINAGGTSSVGDATYAGTGIQPGHYADDLNIQIPDATVPFTFGFPTTTGSIGGTNYVILDGANYVASSLASGTKLYVSKPSVLYVSGNVALDQIVILPGARLDLYVGGATAALSGGAVLNGGGDPQNFKYWGLPSNTTLNINGGAIIVGSIYAPSANITCNADAVLFGALVSKTFTGGGNFDFHYDENLGRSTDSSGFLISSWDEL